ncbi:hypothetical protein B0H14DRAFT_3870997 [Mycena olivaceomarginata]|nr:hypothetical protein B0H14DRAFT_3870997 [Mycena olivaceomarginata]
MRLAYFSPTDALIPGQPTRVRPGYVAAAHSRKPVYSPLARLPSPSPSLCIPRARLIPCAPLALVVLSLGPSPPDSLNSVLGCATGQCVLNYSHVIVEFMSQAGRRLLAITRHEHMERAGLKHFALAPMDMARDWLFSMRRLGLQTGFMPIDLHDSVGTSGVGAGTIASPAVQSHREWPPARPPRSALSSTATRAPSRTSSSTHLVLGAYLARHHSWDAVFQSSVIRTLTHLDLVDTCISGLVLGRVAHAAALVSLTLPGTFEDVKGATVIFAGDHILDEGEGGGRQHTLLPHLHSFRFLLLGPDQHPLYAAVAAFLAHRPLLRRLDLESCPWELVRSLLPTLSGLKVLGVRIAHFNSAAAQGLWGALPRGVHALHLTTIVAERDLLVFETLLKSFHSSHVHLFLLNPLLAGARVARAFLHLQRCKRELKASVAFGAHLSCLLTHFPRLRPPSLTLSFLSHVSFCLPLPDPARELEAQRALALPFAASSCEHCRALFGHGQTICLCLYLQILLAVGPQAEGQHAHPRSLSGPSPLPPLLSPLLVNPPSLPHSLFFFLLSSIPLTNPPSQNEHAPALRAFPALAFLHLQNTATHRPKPNLVSEREFAQQTEGWVAAARGVARALPVLDFLGWHGEHYVVVRRTGERRRLDGRRENGEEGEAEEEVELKELPCRRHLDCGKGVDVGGEDATWLERKDVPIDYEMPVVS